ncbi:MAG: hypothetical protein B7X04_02685 [Parcubacteria group bacterium 21-54-25]|nr:MAG: hypothetical protein B7X04_02685 [Parcubacteria group bacterium 21-54-25]HQU07741.1 hypothetical protein [Candidatus Paceibacterota bacterium]
MEQPPKQKMPMWRAVVIVALAFFVDLLKFFFSILAVTGPLLVGAAAGAAVGSHLGSTAGHVTGLAVMGSSYLFEFASGGIGAAGITFIGEMFALAIAFFGEVLITMMLALSGVQIFSKKAPSKRLATVFVTALLNFVPFINSGPWLTAGTWLIVRGVRKEDRDAQREYEDKTNQERTRVQSRREAASAFFANRQAANEEIPESPPLAA